MFESALRAETARELGALSPREVLVGLPTYRNARSIARLLQAVAEGLEQHYGHLRNLIVVSDGGSTDGTTQAAAEVELPPSTARVVFNYQGIHGRGTAVRSILEAASRVQARVVLLLDADVRNLTAAWIRALAGPLVSGAYEFLLPVYRRGRGEAAASQLIAYPLNRMLYGRDLKEPMAGEVSLSGKLAAQLLRRDVWETDVARAGVDVWMSTLAVNEGVRLAQVHLGAKEHEVRDPVTSVEPLFLQEIGTLFRMMNIYRRRWREVEGVRPLPRVGEIPAASAPEVSLSVEALREAFRSGVKRHRRLWRGILDAETWRSLQEILQARPAQAELEAKLWARLVVDLAVVYNRGEGDPDKVAISLLPLFQLRLATVLSRSEGQPLERYEALMEEQAAAFEPLKGFALQRWDAFSPWPSEVGYP